MEDINDTLEEENDQYKSEVESLKTKLGKLEKQCNLHTSIQN